MDPKNLKTAFILTYVVLALGLVASAGGLFLSNLYRDNEVIKQAWSGNDVVTLLLVIPALAFSMQKIKSGSIKAYVLWIGLLGYMIYNYAFYLFGAALNKFFLLYVGIFCLSLYALILGLMNVNITNIPKFFSGNIPRKGISGFLLLIAMPLSFAELKMYIDFLITGQVPAAPSLIFALDLSLIVPNTALAAILLWQNKSWGYMLGGIMLIKAFTYGMGLSISTILVALKGPYDPLLPFYLFISSGGFFFTFLFFKKYKSDIAQKVMS